MSPEIRWWDWFLTGLLFGFDWRFWLCEEHRYDDADWDGLERELRRFGKLGSP